MNHHIYPTACFLGLFVCPALLAQDQGSDPGNGGNSGTPPADQPATTEESAVESTESPAPDLTADLKAAAEKLAQAGSYAWTTTTESSRGSRTTSGQKGGGDFVKFSMPRRNGESLVILRKGKAVMKGDEGWQAVGSGEDAGGQGRRFFARMITAFQEPAAQAVELVGKVSGVKATDGGFEAELTEQAASDLLSFRGRGRRAGGDGGDFQPPAIEGAGGTVTFTASNGCLTSYTTQLTGKMNFNGQEIDLDRTTTVEFTGLDSTSFDIPTEAVAIFLDMGNE